MVFPPSRRLTRETQREYNGMLVGVFDLVEAKRAELDALRLHVETIRDYRLAHADLERAIGGSIARATQSIEQ